MKKTVIVATVVVIAFSFSLAQKRPTPLRPPLAVATITANPNPVIWPAVTTLTWDAGNDHPNAHVSVKVDNEVEIFFDQRSSKGARTAYNIDPGRTYLFTLVDGNQLLASVIVTAKIREIPEPDIVGMSIACSNDHVYTWYDRDEHRHILPLVTAGTSSNLNAYPPPQGMNYYYGTNSYYLFNKSPRDVIGMGIAGNDHVYAWYRDGMVSSGESTNLVSNRPFYKYSLPPGKTPDDVVGIDIACSDDHVYAWYRDGTVSSGTSDVLDKYSAPHSYSLAPGKKPADIVEIGIAGDDHVYAWYRDRTVSSGTSTKLDQYRPSYSYDLGFGCGLGASVPNLQFGYIVGQASRGPSCESPEEIMVSLKRYNADGSPQTLVQSRVSGTNFELPLRTPCSGIQGRVSVFLEVESTSKVTSILERQRRKATSRTVQIACPAP